MCCIVSFWRSFLEVVYVTYSPNRKEVVYGTDMMSNTGYGTSRLLLAPARGRRVHRGYGTSVSCARGGPRSGLALLDARPEPRQSLGKVVIHAEDLLFIQVLLQASVLFKGRLNFHDDM